MGLYLCLLAAVSIIFGFTLCMSILISDNVIYDRLISVPEFRRLWGLVRGHPQEVTVGGMFSVPVLIIFGMLFLS